MDISILKGKKAVAFSGLADNDQFFESLEQAGCSLQHTFPFADHHRYDRTDIDRIAHVAKEKGAGVIVTSLKDFVKIEKVNRWPVALVVVDLQMKLTQDEDLFLSILSAANSPCR